MGQHPARGQTMLVQEAAVVRGVGVGPLHERQHPLKLILAKRGGRQPLGSLQLPEPGERGLALEPLVQREQDIPYQALVHLSSLSAWWSSSSACSTASAQSNSRARRTSASRSQWRSSAV